MSYRRNYYIRTHRNSKTNKVFVLLDGVKRDEEDDVDNLQNNSDPEFVLQKKLKNEIVTDEQSNYMLIPEANIHLFEDGESEVNDKDNFIESKILLRKTNKEWERQREGKGKEKNVMEFKWNKSTVPNYKQPLICKMRLPTLSQNTYAF